MLSKDRRVSVSVHRAEEPLEGVRTDFSRDGGGAPVSSAAGHLVSCGCNT